MTKNPQVLTLGLDVSTQGVKAVAWNPEAERIEWSASVNYGRDLPQFGSPDGFLPNEDVLVREANPLMWIAGLELALARLAEAGCPMDAIAAVGGDAQQHASVYLTAEGLAGLGSAPADASWFSRERSPIWMDSSTSAQCAALDARFGARMQSDTGSPAIERFAGPQIMKFAAGAPAAYARTARIHLLSSFLASCLAGAEMPIDAGDGAGMNLLNLKTGRWDAEICEFTAPGLEAKLPAVHVSRAPLSRPLSARFARFGLRPGIPVVPFTGDNPASLVGVGAEKPGTAVISLGTSDVFFAAMEDFHVDPAGYGHVFGNPAGGFMSLSCFKNGSLARDRVRRELGVDWRFFDETAWAGEAAGAKRPRAYPYFEAEITPKHAASGIEADFDWPAAEPAVKVRAIVEGQIANMYERTRWIGDFAEIKVTGGASRSKGIRDTIARIFRAEVKAIDLPDSAAVGGARLAARALSQVTDFRRM